MKAIRFIGFLLTKFLTTAIRVTDHHTECYCTFKLCSQSTPGVGKTPSRSLPVVSCDLIFRLAGTNDDAVNSFNAISALAPAFGAGDRTWVVPAHVGPTQLGRSDRSAQQAGSK